MSLLHDHQEAPARQKPPSLTERVRRLDARPRLHERDRRRSQVVAHRDQEPFAGVRLDDHALVHQDVLLEPALEVVAERRVGRHRRQVAVVRLHQAALPDPVVPHRAPDDHDPADHFVAGDRRRLTGHVARDLREDSGIDPAEHPALARMRRERVHELGVGEADADRLHPGKDPVRADGGNRLLTRVPQRTGGHRAGSRARSRESRRPRQRLDSPGGSSFGRRRPTPPALSSA